MSKKKLIIQVCPIGSNTLHEDAPGLPKVGKRTPYLPITPKEVAEETKGLAMILGADSVRVGLEDNIYISHGVLAKSNAELVEKAVRIARELDFEIATTHEAREFLHLKKI